MPDGLTIVQVEIDQHFYCSWKSGNTKLAYLFLVRSFIGRLLEELDDALAHLLGLLEIHCMPSIVYDY